MFDVTTPTTRVHDPDATLDTILYGLVWLVCTRHVGGGDFGYAAAPACFVAVRARAAVSSTRCVLRVGLHTTGGADEEGEDASLVRDAFTRSAPIRRYCRARNILKTSAVAKWEYHTTRPLLSPLERVTVGPAFLLWCGGHDG